jgi:serine/threonine protein phosphatase PrpC
MSKNTIYISDALTFRRVASAVEVVSIKGQRDHQEDRYFAVDINYPMLGITGCLVGVADGSVGASAAEYVTANFERLFDESGNSDPAQRIRDAFSQLVVDVARRESSTTLSVVFVPRDGTTAYVGVLGNSAVWIRAGSGSVLHLCPRHDVVHQKSLPDQGDLGPLQSLGWKLDLTNGYVYRDDPKARMRLMVQCTRVLGLFEATGLIREPEIPTVPIADGGMVILATDGIDEYGDPETIVSKLEQGMPVDQLLAELDPVDNTTVLMLRT